jgi:hypothetical protein
MTRQRIQPDYCDLLWPEQGARRPRNLLLIFHFKIQHLITHRISRQTADLFAYVLVMPDLFAKQAMLANWCAS